MILFCLPYAGGAEAIYYNWKKYLHHSIKLYPIELRGRGRRFNEPLYNSIEEAVQDIFDKIQDKIHNSDYAIYGHSMGSLLAFELYYKINEMKIRKPKHIFFSGYRAPHIIRRKENIYTLPTYDFINKIIEYGGTPKELLENNEILKIFLHILKNDFKMLETYDFKEKISKIQCNISVLNGKQDVINLEDILAWRKHTSGKCEFYNLEGNHFFINNNIQSITNIINGTIFMKE